MTTTRRTKHAGVLLTVAALVGTALVEVPATAADGPVVVDLPSRDRGQPRAVALLGETSTGHLVVRREADPTGRSAGDSQTRVLTPGDGLGSEVAASVAGVVGDRLVRHPGFTTPEVTSRVLPDGEWVTLPVPDGHRYLDHTVDGLVLARTDAEGGHHLSLLPWTGGEPLPVTGLPAGMSVSEAGYGTGPSATVLRIYPADWGLAQRLVVDTRARQAWAFAESGTPCQTSTSTGWGVGESTLAWHGGSTADPVICTVRRPAPGDGAVDAAATRPTPDLAVTPTTLELLPVGDHVVVARRASWTGLLDAGGAAPVLAVAPDGATATLLGWGHDVRPGGAGKVLAVGGTTPADQAIRRVDVPTGTDEVVAPVAPVGAAYAHIAVDGDTVAFVDDSAPGSAVVRNRLAPDGTTWTVGDSGEVLDRNVTHGVTAGEGAVAWGGGEPAGSAWGIRSAEGEVTKGALSSTGLLAGTVGAVSGRWILHADRTRIVDTVARTTTTLEPGARGALLDGVLYLPGSAVAWGPGSSVVARDLETGQASTIFVPDCPQLGSVQAAGSWLLVTCPTPQGLMHRVVDRTGAVASWDVEGGGNLLLGNGFLVQREIEDGLWWTALDGGQALWQRLAEGTVLGVSVSRGPVPTVAWHGLRTARLARLPVAASGLQPHPVGVSKPVAPTPTTSGTDRAVTVSWSLPPATDELTAFVVSRVGGPSQEVAADVTRATFHGLTNGRSYSFTVSAVNIAGRATSAQVAGTPVAPPAPATNVRVTVDPLTSEATVTWDWAPSPDTEELESFDLWVGQPVVEGLAADARSATFVAPDAMTAPVTVYSLGSRQSSRAVSPATEFPGADVAPPTARLSGVPQVLLGRRVTARLAASDDRLLADAPVDVRWRSAAPGRRLGAWQRPAAWQGRAPGALPLTGLVPGSTYCLSVRARDWSGNVSSWTPSRCVAVAQDDRTFTRDGSWRALSGRRFFSGTALSSSSVHSTLDAGPVRVDRGWLVATTCPTCGRVAVYLGNGTWGSLGLRSRVRRDRRLLPLPMPSQVQGRLILRPVRGSGPVIVDGVAVRGY